VNPDPIQHLTEYDTDPDSDPEPDPDPGFDDQNWTKFLRRKKRPRLILCVSIIFLSNIGRYGTLFLSNGTVPLFSYKNIGTAQ